VVEGGARLGVDESVPFAAALRMYTCAGAYASLEEETKGSIAVGQLADLTVLDRESTQLSAEALADAKVRLTVIDGQVVWER
jgi:predicted amidohydrolase YtcJ